MTTTTPTSALYDLYVTEMTDEERRAATQYEERAGVLRDMFDTIDDDYYAVPPSEEAVTLYDVVVFFRAYRDYAAEWVMHAQDLMNAVPVLEQTTAFKDYTLTQDEAAYRAARLLAQHALSYLTGQPRLLGHTG